MKFIPDLIDIIDKENIEKKVDIKEIKIEETSYSIDQELFPIDNQEKANKFVEYLIYERLLFPASAIAKAKGTQSTTNHYFSNTIKILESTKKSKKQAKSEQSGPEQKKEEKDAAVITRSSVAENFGVSRKEIEQLPHSYSDVSPIKLKSISEELNNWVK